MPDDTVAHALRATDRDHWITSSDGTPIPHRTSEARVEAMLRLAGIRPGDHVLEVGTGTGYSSALLADVVGPLGQVVSLDVDPHLVARARTLHGESGNSQVSVYLADGRHGAPAGGAFDRVISWTTPHLVPAAWLCQTAATAVLVSPIMLAPLARACAVLRTEVTDGVPATGDLHSGGFVEATSEPLYDDTALPMRYVDASASGPGGRSWWISAHYLHNCSPSTARALLDELISPAPLRAVAALGDWAGFRSWLLTQASAGCSVGTGGHGHAVGLCRADATAVTTADGRMFVAGDADRGHDMLTHAIAHWTSAGRPGLASLIPQWEATAAGWLVRTAVASRAPLTTGETTS